MNPIEVVPYSPDWPDMFTQEAQALTQVLGDNCVAVHHIGSTSVPRLVAKPKIDVIAVVKDLREAIRCFEEAGYKYKGEINIPFHGFLTKKYDAVQINLHVYEDDNPEIDLNLKFRDYLRTHPTARDEYVALKAELLQQEANHHQPHDRFSGYTLGKDRFIKNILKLAGFNGLCMRFCMHYDEWEVARKYANAETFNAENHVHFVLYQGVEIVGYAHIHLLPKDEADIMIAVADGLHERFSGWCERWVSEVRGQDPEVATRTNHPRACPLRGQT